MAPISSDCWKPAHELSQRGRRVSHQHAVTTPHGTRHEGVLARLPGAQRRCRGTQVAGDPFPAGSGQGQVLPCAGAIPASCGSPLVLCPRRELWARGQAAVASSHLHPQLGAHPSLPTQKKRHQSIHHPCARSPRSGLPASAGRRPGSRLSHSQAGQGDRCCCHGAGLRHVRGDSSTLRSQGGQPGPPSPIIPAQSSQFVPLSVPARCAWEDAHGMQGSAGAHGRSVQRGGRSRAPGLLQPSWFPPALLVLVLPHSCPASPGQTGLWQPGHGTMVLSCRMGSWWAQSTCGHPFLPPHSAPAGTSLGTGGLGTCPVPPSSRHRGGGQSREPCMEQPWPWGCSARSRPPCLPQDYVDALLTNYCVSAAAK